MSDILARLAALFDPGRLKARLIDDFLPDLIVAVVTFTGFYLLWLALSRAVKLAMDRTDVDRTARAFLQTVLRYGVLTIGLVTALAQLGVDTGSLLASLGVAGLTIGFAARDALSNIISGIFIFWDRPFVIGDLVEIGSSYGRVENITMRSTRVVTPDGRMLAIPNAEIVNSTVASYTNFPHLRLEVPVTVAVTEDLDRVRGVLLGLVDGDNRYMNDPPPQMVVLALNDYNVEVALRAWIHDEREHLSSRFALREKVFKALTAAGVDMPYETLRVEHKPAATG